MPETLFAKIWNTHLITESAGVGLVLVDRMFLHERTGGVALQSLRARKRTVASPMQVFATVDHVVDTHPGRNDQVSKSYGFPFIDVTRRETQSAKIRLFDVADVHQGIVHVISPELGIVLPGLTLVCPDSHTGTQGAFGALAWGIGSTEAEHALATQTLRVRKPRTMRVRIINLLASDVTAKDLALYLIATHGSAGAHGAVVEFSGNAVSALDLESRMTLCNMATEFAAFAAIIAPDDQTFAYLKDRPYAPKGRTFDRAVKHWESLHSDPEAHFDREIQIDAAAVRPMVTWGTNPEDAIPIDGLIPKFDALGQEKSRAAYERAVLYMGVEPGTSIKGLSINGAFIGACTNSRLSDLRRAARAIDGRHVAPGVRAICVPGSTLVKRQAEAEGLDQIFKTAGFEWRESGCSMCFYAGGEHFGPADRIISSTNRNFEGRQGPQTRTHLASPETVAASAIAGYITESDRRDR